MSAKTLRALCIGDKVAATPSWDTEWTIPLTVVATGDDEEGRLRVSLRRQESEDEPTYHLVAESEDIVGVYGATRYLPYDRLGQVRNLARVGVASRVKRVQLQYKAERREMPEGDNSWKKYYERRGEA